MNCENVNKPMTLNYKGEKKIYIYQLSDVKVRIMTLKERENLRNVKNSQN